MTAIRNQVIHSVSQKAHVRFLRAKYAAAFFSIVFSTFIRESEKRRAPVCSCSGDPGFMLSRFFSTQWKSYGLIRVGCRLAPVAAAVMPAKNPRGYCQKSKHVGCSSTRSAYYLHVRLRCNQLMKFQFRSCSMAFFRNLRCHPNMQGVYRCGVSAFNSFAAFSSHGVRFFQASSVGRSRLRRVTP